MSIIRIGSNDKYASGWDLAFSGRKAKASGGTATKKKASPKKAGPKKPGKKGKK